MKSNIVRDSFLRYFEERGHKIVPSAPVVPQDDPTLLFTNAGMNQFKNIFLGLEKRDYTRVANSQKCIRVSGKHNDLEEVGKDTYHHTFFEMLGNWSFGDYYKKEAIEFAWELLTAVWKLPKNKLWATVFREDKEAENMWRKVTDIRRDQILRFDEKENFWEMGESGPCGPCSEIHIDLGEEKCDKNDDSQHRCGVNAGCGRFIELWNLVFIQYDRQEDGSLKELPAKHVDTGMGFERLVAVLEGVDSNYDTDLFVPIVDEINRITGIEYPGNDDGVAHRVIADHVRTLTFAIADGVMPSNEGRGYVLRRILRRAARFGRLLNMHEPFIYKLVSPVVDIMGEAYPEIKERHQHITRVIHAEEESFGKTLDRGIEIFEEKVQNVVRAGQEVFPGKDAFLLYDTYGFPLDLTQLMAEEKGMVVDVRGFEEEMQKQRQRSKEAATFSSSAEAVWEAIKDLDQETPSVFKGYELDETEAKITSIAENSFTLDTTPFYPESGGQVGDQGVVFSEGFEVQVTDTKRIHEQIVHIGKVIKGSLDHAFSNHITVKARIDVKKRRNTERNHTATHLLHKALRTVLGEHVNQAGSLVHPDYLRFDFTHYEKVKESDLEEIERLVNESIRANYPLRWMELPFDEAKKMGAMALFGEKYGDVVRMVEIDDYSRELCGGTHVRATGEIGYFRILSESAVAAGIRRIEAVTGEAADGLVRQEKKEIEEAKKLLRCQTGEISNKLRNLIEERRSLEKKLREAKVQVARSRIAQLVQHSKTIDTFRVVAAKTESSDVEELKKLGDVLREELKSGVGVLGAIINGKGSFVCVVTKDLITGKKLNAGDIIHQVAKLAGGGGGGNPYMALAGARDVSKIDEALIAVEHIVRKMIENY